MPDANLEKLVKESMVQMVKNSVGTKAFNSFYCRNKETGEIVDVLQDGKLSCASFVSSILTINGLIDCPHATTSTVIANLTAERGWHEAITEEPGDVVLWEEIGCEGEENCEHLGFAISKDEAISTSSKKREVAQHHLTYGTNEDGSAVRNIKKIFRNTNI